MHEIETSTFPIINTDAERYLNIGAGLFSLGKSQEAVACYQRAAEINPNNAEIYYNMGVALNRQDKSEAAILCYCKALKISPNLARAYIEMGLAFNDQGQPEEAIACYLKALEIAPNHASAFNNLGTALKAQGKTDEALTNFRHAIEFDPELDEAHINLGCACQDLGNIEEAIRCFRNAIEIRPTSSEALCFLGDALLALQNTSEAITCYQHAVEIDPEHVQAFYHMGLALTQQGKTENYMDAYADKCNRYHYWLVVLIRQWGAQDLHGATIKLEEFRNMLRQQLDRDNIDDVKPIVRSLWKTGDDAALHIDWLYGSKKMSPVISELAFAAGDDALGIRYLGYSDPEDQDRTLYKGPYNRLMPRMARLSSLGLNRDGNTGERTVEPMTEQEIAREFNATTKWILGLQDAKLKRNALMYALPVLQDMAITRTVALVQGLEDSGLRYEMSRRLMFYWSMSLYTPKGEPRKVRLGSPYGTPKSPEQAERERQAYIRWLSSLPTKLRDLAIRFNPPLQHHFKQRP